MLDKLRQHWKDFKASKPGQRFKDLHKRRGERNGRGAGLKKWLLIGLGILLVLAGIFFLAAPGPGLVVLALGLALIAGESLTMARLLDWLELKLTPLYQWGVKRWKRASGATRFVVYFLLGLLGLAAGWFAWMKFMH